MTSCEDCRIFERIFSCNIGMQIANITNDISNLDFQIQTGYVKRICILLLTLIDFLIPIYTFQTEYKYYE